MGDWGLKVSQQGYDVKTCADKEMLLHSSFKHLKIYMEGSFTGKTAGQTVATHNLGYAPIFCVLAWNSSQSRLLPTIDEDYLNYECPRISSANLIQSSSGNIRTAGYYYIFQEQLNQNYSPVSIQPTTTSQGTQVADYGMKSSKDTYDVKTAAVKNLIMTSGRKAASEQAKLHIIHSITTGTYPTGSDPWPITITHNLGYIPMVWWFLKEGEYGDSRWALITSHGIVSAPTIDSTKTEINFDFEPLPGNYACVIFKDPTS